MRNSPWPGCRGERRGCDLAACVLLRSSVGDTGRRLADTASASTIVDAPGRRYVADVQDWLSRPETNFGWVIVGNEVDLKVAKRIDSREIEDESKRPILTVSYTMQTATAVAEQTWGQTKQSGGH